MDETSIYFQPKVCGAEYLLATLIGSEFNVGVSIIEVDQVL